nr:uncharacterized protein LOC110631536 [Ipomoea trifida]
MTLCSRYLKSIKTKFNRLERNNDGGFHTTNAEISIFSKSGRALGAGIARNLSDDEWLQAHIYVLKNCDEVQSFLKFRIEDTDDKGCRTQNSGVYVIGDLGIETNPFEYYGVLTEILELQYLGARRVVLFRCRWFNVHDNEKGSKVDEYGFTTINPERILRTNEPFTLANQASHVFYGIDNMIKGWHVVIKTQPCDLYKMPQSEEIENDIVEDLGEAYQYGESFNFECSGVALNFYNQRARTDVEPIIVQAPTIKKSRKRKAA